MQRVVHPVGVLVLAVFVGCMPVESAEVTTEARANPVDAASTGAEAINLELERFTIAVARAMKSSKMRHLIKDDAARKRTGDTEALVRYLQDESQGTFLTTVVESYRDAQIALGDSMSAATADRAVASLTSRIGNLHVAVRTEMAKWDPVQEVPLVTFVPVGVQEENIQTLRAYDSDGTLYLLDPLNPPKFSLLVVGTNERTEPDGTVMRPFMPCVPNAMGEISPRVGCDSGGGGGGGGTVSCGSSTPSRVSGMAEHLGTLSVRDDSEPFFMGDAEMRLQIGTQSGAVIYSGYFTRDWDSVTSVTYCRALINWYDSLGNYLMYHWVEEDGGPTINVNVTGAFGPVTANVTYTIHNDDDQLGHTIVGFADPPRTYDLGYVYWTERWRW